MKNKNEKTAISYEEAVSMVKHYRAYMEMNPVFDAKTHVKSVWFSMEQLTKIYERLKEESSNGLRVYFGRYPDDVSDFSDPKPIANTDTIILISTKANGLERDGSDDGSNDDDYDLIENRGEQCQPHCGGITIDDKP